MSGIEVAGSFEVNVDSIEVLRCNGVDRLSISVASPALVTMLLIDPSLKH